MNYLKWWVLALGSACWLGAGCAVPATRGDNVFASPLWDDGRAEFSTYVGTTRRYGEERATEARLIVVKEDLLRASLVKSDAGPIPGRTVEAIKLNVVADFRTGVYTYHQTASLFFDRTTMQVLKEAMSHTEACGITYVRIGPKGGRLVHEAHSYWDGEADREVALAWPAGGERLYWDGLPVSLRRWMSERAPVTRKVWLLPSQLSGQSPIENTRPVEASIHMSAGGTIAVPAGRFDARRFVVETALGADTLWFDERFPHPVLKLDTAAGRHLALLETMRLDYWNHHAEGDERLLRSAD
ncbi:MAG: hypothetical protein E6K78_04185 [Candidatus Eisenbacteria bacterium]|uniref:DUF3108 domain-containing protein n=1 Tax=Eiseniibacteriota bacterium TaxID=2212470 RepID=A0A538TVE2_UNCEI|nr:MAG: hypothetical protein E6K78_04185 [Candidatus Eisenbacteria bacterium]